jgi:AcrR family transcriptional regulator
MQATAPTSSPGASKRPRRGRPRDPGLDKAILDSAFELMVETGIPGFSVREVARRSGIPKSSIYRRWATRAELLAAVLARLSASDAEHPDSGDVRADLTAAVRREISSLESSGAALPRVALEARDDPELAPVVRDVIASRRRAAYPIFERAVERGEISRDVDIDVAIDLVLGPIWSRLIAQRTLVAGDAEEIVDRALHGLSPNSKLKP